MADEKKIEVLRLAAEKLRAEIAEKSLVPPTDKELNAKIVNALKMRGASTETIDKLIEAQLGFAIWSKTYTENSKSRLIAKDGSVLVEVNAPLTQAELELIEDLGLRKNKVSLE